MNFNNATDPNNEINRKIRIGAVSYLNSKPLIYGLENGLMKDEAELIIDYPSNIAQALLNNSIDIGLVPVAIMPEMKEYHHGLLHQQRWCGGKCLFIQRCSC
jgi:Menaquinone biosynthesis